MVLRVSKALLKAIDLIISRFFCAWNLERVLMVRNDEHAKRLIKQRKDAGLKGKPKAVQRYEKRTGKKF